MKVLIGAAVAALAFASTAAAQPAPQVSANCSGFSAAPTLPDGATATSRQMTSGNDLYQAWGNERVAKLQSCRADVEALRVQLNALEAAYNTANAELASVTGGWEAEVAEYNARGGDPAPGERRRGGVITRPDGDR
jgi:Skp family chaperone for outer membrane proteins